MADFLRNAGSLSWWIGVVFVGILLNLVSAYLKPKIDGSLSKISTGYKHRLSVREELRESLLKTIRTEAHEQLMAVAAELRCRARSIELAMITAVCLISNIVLRTGGDPTTPVVIRPALAVIALGLGTLSFLLGLSELRRAIRLKDLLFEARGKGRSEIGRLE